MNFDLKIYMILSTHYGKLDLLLRDTITAIREIAQGTTKVDRYDYEEQQ